MAYPRHAPRGTLEEGPCVPQTISCPYGQVVSRPVYSFNSDRGSYETPDDAVKTLFQDGCIDLGRGRTTEGITKLEEAANWALDDIERARALTHVAEAYLREGDVWRARQAVNEILVINPEYSAFHPDLQGVYQELAAVGFATWERYVTVFGIPDDVESPAWTNNGGATIALDRSGQYRNLTTGEIVE
ncbi:MAG: hypothetical protein KKA90_00415 [Nanoarchaeota archaeon]|nr:hypothetical protein [Nanoarchaeota archaeon]